MSGHVGCKRPDVAERNKRNAIHGMTYSPAWNSYSGAKNRCTNEKNVGWAYYGGRGIEFRFDSFQEFYEELGDRPEGMSLDRIDPNGHYEKGNVRWATFREQVANRRQYVMLDKLSDEELVVEMARRGYACIRTD